MTYLDERIEFKFTLQYNSLPTIGMCKYELYQYDPYQVSDETLIFTGNFYYDGYASITLDVTDIIRSLVSTLPNKLFTDSTVDDAVDVNLLGRYKMKAYFSTGTMDSGWKAVSMVYRYPNYRNTSNFSNGSNIFWDIHTTTTGVKAALQGFDGDTYALVPHYPLKYTEVYKYAQSFLNGDSVQQINLSVEGGGYGEDIYIETARAKTGTAYLAPISEMIVWENLPTAHNNNLHILLENDTEIAILDACYKRYYLLWQDRFGGFQSQAFTDKTQYSESFDVTESQNYKNERKKSNIHVQPKWKVSSEWIEEELYPLYESIYVSPILLLYDSYEDKLYEVISNGSYTEKTYRSEKRLLSMTLELEATSKQQIIY